MTHPFRPLPESLQLRSSEEQVLTHLDLFRGDPVALFYHLQSQRQNDTARRLAEWRLRAEPDDETMLLAYANSPPPSGQPEHVEEFLRAGLTNRPVQVAWHRTYQEVCRNRQGNRQLAAEYDALVKNEPANSALLYLRGRICDDHQEGRRWLDRACEADPRNPYPVYALAYDRMAVADAAKLCRLDSVAEADPQQVLSLAVAWRLAGNVTEADRCRTNALAILDRGDADWKRAAALLRRPTDPTRAELDDIILPVGSKAILLTVLA